VANTRTYTFGDPSNMAAVFRVTDGLEFAHQLASAQNGHTPMFATLGYALDVVERGRVVYVGQPGEHVYNPIGMVHGGYAAAMIDSAAGTAIQTLLPAGTGYTTMDLSLHNLRPISSETGPIRAVGEVINIGRRTALAQVEVLDGNGRLLSHGTSSCMLLPAVED
jgi:uncharacterized protein (TIGR00369 family)